MKIPTYIARLQANLFTYKVLKRALEVPFYLQYKYLLSLGKPENDLQRMVLKDKCQMRYSVKTRFTLNFISLFVYPLVFIYVSLRKLKCKKENVDLIFLDCANFNEIYPEQLIDEFKSRVQLKFNNEFFLKKDDIKYIFAVFVKNRLSLYLLLRFTLKLATYRFIIEKYSPKAIAITNETSPTSVAMTTFCERNNVEHINFMHGEKFLTINDSFVHFHRFYVFDEHYKNNFLKLKADVSTSFIIHKPFKFSIEVDRYRNIEKIVDFTYYLEEFTETEIRSISDSIDSLIMNGYNLRVRPHPRFYNNELLYKYIDDRLIENNKIVSIYESISSCRMVISLCSAILYQCHMVGVKVAIDDISNPQAFKNLLDKNYIMFQKPHYLLSELISNSSSQLNNKHLN